MAALAASADGSERDQRIAGSSKAATTEQQETPKEEKTPLMQQRSSLNGYPAATFRMIYYSTTDNWPHQVNDRLFTTQNRSSFESRLIP